MKDPDPEIPFSSDGAPVYPFFEDERMAKWKEVVLKAWGMGDDCKQYCQCAGSSSGRMRVCAGVRNLVRRYPCF
ncbi:hypothetical protein CEXT_458941 [Caerostris extrusa]|uniref:Uncharacterized protein n=1 Tax=Caerostris extrusa TaxID=172846 RepID=A0AAV4MLI2_CAEEX|nr:hypothetical protein CEXT_458941 [Caerostris extrusa]